MDPPLSTLPLKRSVSGPGPTTRTSFVPPPSPSTSTRSKRPKLASPLDLASSSSSHSSRSAAAASLKAVHGASPSRKDRKLAGKAAAGGAGGVAGRKGKARMMMDEEEQLELRKLDNEEEEDEEEYVWDLVGIKREQLEADTFLFLSQAYSSLRESMIARVVDPFIDYAENHTSPVNPSLSHLTAHLSPILAHLKPLLIRRALDVLKDGDEDLYLITSPICTEEMLDREEFIYAPLRTLLHTLYTTELSHASNLARTPGPGGKTAGNVKNALGWVLLRIAQRSLEDARWTSEGKVMEVERVGGRRTQFEEDGEDGESEEGREE